MEKKIELLLRVVSDMKRFESGNSDAHFQYDSDELSASELELISAAQTETLFDAQNLNNRRSD